MIDRYGRAADVIPQAAACGLCFPATVPSLLPPLLFAVTHVLLGPLYNYLCSIGPVGCRLGPAKSVFPISFFSYLLVLHGLSSCLPIHQPGRQAGKGSGRQAAGLREVGFLVYFTPSVAKGLGRWVLR